MRHRALRLTHHHPGRLRVRSDALCESHRDPKVSGRLANIRAALEAASGVRAVRHAPDAGSILVEYEPGLVDPNDLIDAIASAADLDPPRLDDAAGSDVRLSTRVVSAARKLDAFAQDLTGGRAALREMVPLAMTAVAAYSFVAKKDRLPRWDNLAYWAFSVFLALDEDGGSGAGERPS